MKNIFVTLFIAGLVTGCGGDDADQSKTAAATAPAETASSAPAVAEGPGEISPGVYKLIDGIMIVDHARDEKEFELRRSISSVESLLESAKKAGQDTAELQARLGELQKQLKDLLAG